MSESLKIAFYSDSFLPAVDGVVVSILNFRKELERRGHEVYIFASGTEKTKRIVKGDDHIVVVPSIKFSKYPQYNIAFFPLASRFSFMNVKMDVNHAHTPFVMGWHALMLSKFDRRPIVGSFHTMFTDSAVIREYAVDNKYLAKAFKNYSWKYARLFYNMCDGVSAPSGAIKSMLKSKKINNVTVVPNGVDLKRFNSNVNGDRVRKNLLKSNRGKLVMYVGRVSREKKLETMIRAASTFKKEDVRFVVVGTGPAMQYYQHMVERLHLQDRIRFVGFVENRSLPEYYAACDAFCIPSTFETQGVVSLEAMASGKPVVGADYLALKELIINGRNGEKFRPGDSKGCASKLRKVLYNVGSYKEMVSTAKRYSLERTTDDLLSLYKKVLNNDNIV